MRRISSTFHMFRVGRLKEDKIAAKMALEKHRGSYPFPSDPIYSRLPIVEPLTRTKIDFPWISVIHSLYPR